MSADQMFLVTMFVIFLCAVANLMVAVSEGKEVSEIDCSQLRIPDEQERRYMKVWCNNRCVRLGITDNDDLAVCIEKCAVTCQNPESGQEEGGK